VCLPELATLAAEQLELGEAYPQDPPLVVWTDGLAGGGAESVGLEVLAGGVAVGAGVAET